MKYVSTRGAAPAVGFDDALLAGLAPDGGLYVPDIWPRLADGWASRFADAPYAPVAIEVMSPFVEGAISGDDFGALVHDAYARFDHPDVTPLRELGDGLWLLELHHGPTLAFKDVALQLVGRLFDHELARRGERATIVVATSGDTGSAAIEACVGRDTLDIVVLHPAGRVSEVQRRQMTTVDAPNVHNVAVAHGTFDDCQDLVKGLFADVDFRQRVRLSAMNSINWARVMAQVVYYVIAAARLSASPVSFAVPSGNFGNVLAGWVARRMGVPVNQLVVGSNRNDILTRWLDTGVMAITEVHPTLSPSMDIAVSSNTERLLFELFDRDGGAVAEIMARLRAAGTVDVGPTRLAGVGEVFDGATVDDDVTLAEIARRHAEHGLLVDPHTAVGLAAARARRRDPSVPMVALATAHPAKFPDAVERATGIRPPLPPALADLLDRPERCTTLANDVDAVRQFVLDRTGH
ncbi:threonine synthase [soil metagenome]